jgi:hypothetical protein
LWEYHADNCPIYCFGQIRCLEGCLRDAEHKNKELEAVNAALKEASKAVVGRERIERQSPAISAVNVPPELGRTIDKLAALLEGVE